MLNKNIQLDHFKYDLRTCIFTDALIAEASEVSYSMTDLERKLRKILDRPPTERRVT